MATSGSIDFTMTGFEIVEKAVAIVAERSSEIPLQNNEVSDGLNALNRMAKHFQGQGLHLWKREEGVLFLDPGITSYKLGPQGAEATMLDDFIDAEITVAALSGVNVITVDDTTGMQGLIDSGVADFIGIELDDGTRQWTTIANVSSSTELQITDNLTDDVAIGNSVFTFTTLIERPLRIEAARRLRLGDNSEIELNKWARQQYFAQTNKNSKGTPTNFYYTPQLGNGEIFIWQTADSVNQLLKFTFQRSIEDFDTSADTLDFPIEWADALVWGLAARIGFEYQAPLQKMQLIKQNADQFLDDMLGWDEETVSLNIQPSPTRA